MTVMCFPIFPFLTTDHTLIIFVQHWAFPVFLYGHSYCIILIIWWLGSSMEVRNLLFPAFFFWQDLCKFAVYNSSIAVRNTYQHYINEPTEYSENALKRNISMSAR